MNHELKKMQKKAAVLYQYQSKESKANDKTSIRIDGFQDKIWTLNFFEKVLPI